MGSRDFCVACGEGIFTQEESEDYLSAVGAFRASIDAEPLVPTEVRRIRKKLGLSQREAGEIFGPASAPCPGTSGAKLRQGKVLDKLLRLLDRHPDLLDEIRVKVAA